MKPMSPDEARDLLDNFDQLLPFEAELAMEGAAKDMAAMIAGMREEWGYEYESLLGGRVTSWGFMSEVAASWDMKIALKHHWDDHQPTRIVRRYVTEPEEA